MRKFWINSLALLLLVSLSAGFGIIEIEMTPRSSLQAQRSEDNNSSSEFHILPNEAITRKLLKNEDESPDFSGPSGNGSSSSSYEMTMTREFSGNGGQVSEMEGTKRVTLPGGEVVIERVSKPMGSDQVFVTREVQAGRPVERPEASSLENHSNESNSPLESLIKALIPHNGGSPSTRKLGLPVRFSDIDELLRRKMSSSRIRRRRRTHKRITRRSTRRHRRNSKRNARPLASTLMATLGPRLSRSPGDIQGLGLGLSENSPLNLLGETNLVQRKPEAKSLTLGKSLLDSLFSNRPFFADFDEAKPLGKTLAIRNNTKNKKSGNFAVLSIPTKSRRARRRAAAKLRRRRNQRRRNQRRRAANRNQKLPFSGFPLMNLNYRKNSGRSNAAKSIIFPKLGHRRAKIFNFKTPLRSERTPTIVAIKLEKTPSARPNRISFSDLIGKIKQAMIPI